MIKQVSPREKKLLLSAGILVGGYLLISFVFQPIFDKQRRIDRQIQDKIQFIQKFHEVLNRRSYYDAKIQANRETHNSLARRFLDETKPGLAAAGLQKILEEFARKSAVSIGRVRVGKPKSIEGMTGVPVEITLRSNLKNLSQFIYSLENFEKFLIIEDMVIRRLNSSGPEELQTKLMVDGFIRPLDSEEIQKT
ncbi:MAG: type II secretion system protein GspM [Nitrospinaceae bacterium]